VTDLVLSDASIREKRHENVMSSVMRRSLNRELERNQNARGRKHTDKAEPW
jgi:hypothetical protein